MGKGEAVPGRHTRLLKYNYLFQPAQQHKILCNNLLKIPRILYSDQSLGYFLISWQTLSGRCSCSVLELCSSCYQLQKEPGPGSSLQNMSFCNSWHCSQLHIIAGVLEQDCNLCVPNFTLPKSHPSIKCLTQPSWFTFVFHHAYLRLFTGVLLLDLGGFWTESSVLV